LQSQTEQLGVAGRTCVNTSSTVLASAAACTPPTALLIRAYGKSTPLTRPVIADNPHLSLVWTSTPLTRPVIAEHLHLTLVQCMEHLHLSLVQ
jgi:hypothetical protein